MEIREYLGILRRRFWIPLVLVLAAVLLTTTFTFFSKPDYIATATVVAKSQSGTSTSPTLSFTEVATSNSLMLRVRRQLGLTETVDQLTGQIKVSTGRSNLYTLSATDSNPDRAVRLANAAATQACQLYQELAGVAPDSIVKDLAGDRTTLENQYAAAAQQLLVFTRQHPDAANSTDTTIGAEYLRLHMAEQAASQSYLAFAQDVTKARVDEIVNARTQARDFEARVVDEAAARQDTTGRFLRVAYVGGFALIAGILIGATLEYFDNAVRKPEEVEELVGAPVVGIIPRALRTA